MVFKPKQEIFLVVSKPWYEAARAASLLDTSADGGNGVCIFAALLIDNSEQHGIWVEPIAPFASFTDSKVFVPWSVIITIAVLSDSQKKTFGLAPSK